MVIDDIVYVGSANLDPRSLAINFEIMLRIRCPLLAQPRRGHPRAGHHLQRTRAPPIPAHPRRLVAAIEAEIARTIFTRLDPGLAQALVQSARKNTLRPRASHTARLLIETLRRVSRGTCIVTLSRRLPADVVVNASHAFHEPFPQSQSFKRYRTSSCSFTSNGVETWSRRLLSSTILFARALLLPFPPRQDWLPTWKAGPTYIQARPASLHRADMMPQAYMDASRVSRTTSNPFPSIKCRPSWRSRSERVSPRAFSEFEIAPIAAPRSDRCIERFRSGQTVVVKVQPARPGQIVSEDLEAMAEIAQLLDAHTESAAVIMSPRSSKS